MILVDQALEEREAAGNPIRVGMIGAGCMGQGLTTQIEKSVRGMRMVAIQNRTIQRAHEAYRDAGCQDVVEAVTQDELEDGIRAQRPVVTEDASLLARSEQIDVLVEVTGSVEFGAQVVLEAMEHGKDIVLMNAELDATLGPILQVYAERHGVIVSACEGDEPGVQMNLFRWVKGLGFIPRVLGNVKGLQDSYRNPTTQKGFAEKWRQNPVMVTSFADGTKVSYEQAIVANATGFSVRTRGMSRGLEYRGDATKLGDLYDLTEIRALGGIVDYVVGTPLAKVFCLAEHPDPNQHRYLELFKMGEGPLYSFFAPYHLVFFEVPNAIARVALFRDAVAAPLGGPVVEVCAVAKRDLKAGEVLDDFGMYMTYGEAVNTAEMCKNRYLPEGMVLGCRVLSDVAKDSVVTYDDVALPEGRLVDRLRAEQYMHFLGEDWLQDLID